MKYKIFTALALAGSALAELFGGWDMALETLLILMAADWITGGILLPSVFDKNTLTVFPCTGRCLERTIPIISMQACSLWQLAENITSIRGIFRMT